MSKIQHALRVLLFMAASALVVNDCVRLVFSFNEQYMISQLRNYQEQEENNQTNAFSLFEEEVKHKEITPAGCIEIIPDEGIEVYIAHLIQDDEVKHLAFMAIFSPPPNLV